MADPVLTTLLDKLPGILLERGAGWVRIVVARFRPIPLPEAARILYEDARHHKTLLGEASERFGKARSPEEILDYMAVYMAQDHPIYGKRPPSTRIEVIEPIMSKTGTFSGGAATLRLRDRANTEFTDLRIGRRELRRVRKELLANQ